MQTNIQPVTFFPYQATALRIDGVKVRGFGDGGSATIICTFLDSSGNPLSSSVVDMHPGVYALWGTDDDYVLDVACQSLGLTMV